MKDLNKAHLLARTTGFKPSFYYFVRKLLFVMLKLGFSVSITGTEHIPKQGAAIITPNHKAFTDSFFIVLATPRPIHFMQMAKNFKYPWGHLFVWLGSFPVHNKRGESDAAALETSRILIEKGNLFSIFPEGVSVRDRDSLGNPRRGAARLAMETGTPIIPCAITGTERRRFLGVPIPRQVRISFSAPIYIEKKEAVTPEDADALLKDKIWPAVQERFTYVRNHPGVVATGVGSLVGGAALLSYLNKQKKK